MTPVLIPGADRAWDMLRDLDPVETARRAGARHDPASGRVLLRSFGRILTVDCRAGNWEGPGSAGPPLPDDHIPLFDLAVPWYLAHARDIPPTGKLVRPDSLPGGDIFSRGTHVLPLAAVARKYGEAPEAFREAGKGLGGVPVEFGDVAVEVRPLPRIPLTLILWVRDDEFPPRTDLLADSSVRFQAPVDVLWAVAMTTVGMFLAA